MGIFIKFECSKCGEYECDCSYEERRGRIKDPIEDMKPKSFTYEGRPYYLGDILVSDDEQLYLDEIDLFEKQVRLTSIKPTTFYTSWRKFSVLPKYNVLVNLKGT